MKRFSARISIAAESLRRFWVVGFHGRGRIGLVLVLGAIVGLGAVAIWLRTSGAPVVSTNECPRDLPEVDYADLALAWVARRDGIPVPPESASPLNSPLGAPGPGSIDPAVAELVSSRLRPLLGTYLVTRSRFLYISELGTCYVSVTILKHRDLIINELLIDVNSRAVSTVADVVRLRDERRVVAPAPARIDDSLRTRLNAMSGNDRVRVALWFKTEAGMDVGSRQERAFAYLVRTYPKAAENQRLYGKPLGLDEKGDNLIIRQEYHRLMTADVSHAPVIRATSRLAAAGIGFKDMSPMPAILASLTKSQVDEFARSGDVAEIFLDENGAEPALLDAAESHQLGPVWSSGITGTGQMIAILENGNVQQSNSYLNFYPFRLVSPNGDTDHATEVAAAAASYYSAAPGSGRGASILSVGVTTEQADAISGLAWATNPPYSAKIVNYSMAVCASGTMQLIDRGFDFWARQNNVLITASAGNDASYVCSPAIAYNVLGIGGFNNQNTGAWADDVMYQSSSWRNPYSANADREKPEVVAVGENLSIWGYNNIVVTNSKGTSLASPQVAGLGALMANANSELTTWPEASRAIIMASAVHNIEGSTRITQGVDIKDGTGAIVGDQAVAAAKTRADQNVACERSCWWGESLYGTYPGDTIRRTFPSKAGQRVRIAISWWSTAGPSPYNTDELDTNLDLYVEGPSGSWVADGISNSRDNNYELVDFAAPDSGTYIVVVFKTFSSSTTAPINFVGIAVVQPRYDAYLPIAQR